MTGRARFVQESLSHSAPHQTEPVPARASQLIGIDAAEKRGEHEAEDFAESLLLSSPAAFDLSDEVIGQAQVMEGLVEGFDITLGLFLLAFVSLLSVETPPCDGFGLLF